MFYLRLAFIVAFILVWEIGTGGLIEGVAWLDPFLISSPSRIWADMINGLTSGRLLSNTLVTIGEAATGLVLGIVTGLIVGLAFAFSEKLAEFGEPFMRALNALPRPALAPLMIVWFGLGFSGKVFMAWSLVFFIVFYNTYTGAKAIDQDVLNVAKIFKASRFQLLRMVILPGVFTWIFAALRVSVSFALVGAIIGEFVGARAGLGYELVRAQGLLQTDRVFSSLVIIGVVAVVLIEGAQRLEDRLLKWRPPVKI